MSSNLDVRYEDEHLLVVNKPAGVLSQPGKTVDGSIDTQIHEAYPHVNGPMLVHRLDMDTSGLMIFAKSRDVHRHLQQQFEHRKVTKRYTAILSRTPSGLGGKIHLPLRLDVDNRPAQIMCPLYGKSATTLWCIKNDTSEHNVSDIRVLFVPLSGRTHQLRVHAAHPYGLHAPIIGDRLYGVPAERLLLHADRIAFWHPVSDQRVLVKSDVPF